MINKAYRAFWTCKGTCCKTWGGALCLHLAYQTCADLWLHDLAAEDQQERAQEVKEISLSGHNRGDEDDPNSGSGGAFGTSSLMHLALSSQILCLITIPWLWWLLEFI